MTLSFLENTVKDRAAQGEPSFGSVISSVNPDLVEFLGHAGFHWMFLDAAAGDIDREGCQTLVRSCNLVGVTPIVRVPANRESVILSYLEAGALGIVVPHVETADDVRSAIAGSLYGPLGHRGAGSTSRTANHGVTQSSAEYFAAANEQVVVIAQIDTGKGVQNLDEILSVEALFGAYVDAAELAQDLRPDESTDGAEVERVVGEAERTIRSSGKVLMSCIADADGTTARRHVDAGSLLVAVSANSLIDSVSSRFMAEARD